MFLIAALLLTLHASNNYVLMTYMRIILINKVSCFGYCWIMPLGSYIDHYRLVQIRLTATANSSLVTLLADLVVLMLMQAEARY